MSTGFIYAISSPSTDRIYIGSTTSTLAQRFSRHKCDSLSSQEIIKYGDAIIELLEEIEFNNKDELLWKEREYMEIFGEQCVNERHSIITEEEKKELIKETIKKYRENNKEYYKKWNENNREMFKEYNKKYYEKNKEKIKEKRREKKNKK